ncbi:hypothetical protein AB0873_32210 [Micromonospora sp. NPDC047707]|uniref:hypothetical protein n=1 Tax=Micromonospora sp. NPDC047707 TaxID=3154498 RepID=UPI0034568DE9
MTKRRVTISVPPDVAETLERQPNASAYVTETVRARRNFEEFRELMVQAGVQLTEEGMAAARARRLAVQAEWTPERVADLRERVRDHMDAELSGGDRQAPAA